MLGKENHLKLGKTLQETAREEKDAFLDFVAELGRYQKDERHWWASNLAYKTHFASDFFLLWCYIAIFDKVCSKYQYVSEGSLYCIVEDRWLYRYLWLQFGKNGNNYSFPCSKSIYGMAFKGIIRGIAGRIRFSIITSFVLFQLKWHGIKTELSDSNHSEKNVFIYSWIQERSFRASGEFSDIYFGRLPELLTAHGFHVSYIAAPFISVSLKKKCLDHNNYVFRFADQYIGFGALAKSMASIFRISSGPMHEQFSLLLWRQMISELSSFPVAVLHYQAFKEMLKELDENTPIVYPFENQPWEKMLCLAARELGRKTRLIAYQHTMVPPMLLNYFLGAGEYKDMPLPNVIVTNGEHTLDLLKNAGYGIQVEIVNGGALRFEYFYYGKGKTKLKESDSKTVLVTLPYSHNLSEELMSAVTDNFTEPVQDRNIKFLVKFHPVVPPARLGIDSAVWPEHICQTDSLVSEMLPEVDLVIYTSSSTGLEALLNNVPVVRYCSESIPDIDPLDGYCDNLVKWCSREDLREAVLSLLQEQEGIGEQQSSLSVDRFFSPINEDLWKRIVSV